MKKLVFVYNADSGWFNAATDIAHKIFSPATYPCSLCAVTHGVFSVRKEWEIFVQEAPIPFEFFHRDEFSKKYPALAENTRLPVVLLLENEECVAELSAVELDLMGAVSELQKAVLSLITP